MADSLKGKTGVIVGAGYGVGRAIAIHLARRGARLVIASRSKDELLATQKLISESGGERPLVCTVDVSQPSEVELLQKAAMNHLGRCDFMVSTVFGHVGEDEGRNLEEVNVSELESFAKVSIVGNWLLLRSFAASLRESAGRAVFIVADWGMPTHNVFTSGKSENVQIGSEAFVSAKYAIHGLITASDRQLGLTSCGIYPGIVASKRSDGSGYYELDDESALEDEAYQEGWAIPLRDLANSVEFCLTTTSVAKSLVLKPQTVDYDGLHL